MSKKLQSKQIAVTFAAWSALFMLVLWLLGNAGIYTGAVEMMANWHMFFDLTITGLILGMVEAAVISYVLVLVFVWIYNFIGEKL